MFIDLPVPEISYKNLLLFIQETDSVRCLCSLMELKPQCRDMVSVAFPEEMWGFLVVCFIFFF